MESNMPIYELLNKIEYRPELYLGEKSIVKLRIYLMGFAYGLTYPDLNEPLYDFQLFIEYKYNNSRKTALGWDSILLKYTNGNEEMALNLFFKELKIFMLENNIKFFENK